MTGYAAIFKHYEHWDNFVRLWKIGARPDVSYMPEPWWGWHPAGNESLQSVVVNLSPGHGGKLQSPVCMACTLGCGMGALSYSSAMFGNVLRTHLADTERWHYRRRYLPLMNALQLSDDLLAPDTRHHLSIELAPYHSNSDLLNREYLLSNKEDVFEHTLCFAARAARLISTRLKNIVMVRAVYSKIREVVGDLISEPQAESRETEKGKVAFDIFHLNCEELKDVSFVCLTGAHNNLPCPEKLKEIINYIHKLKNSQ